MGMNDKPNPSASQPVKPDHIFSDWLLELKKDLRKRGALWSPTLITSPVYSRTVVLRQLDEAANPHLDLPAFIIHTDIRSQKWRQLQQDPSCALHFYCAKRKWQMRVVATARLHHDDTYAITQWQALSASAQRIYGLQHCPGVSIEDPEAAFTFNDKAQAQANFGVICMTPLELESLQLQRPDKTHYHVRAKWDIANNLIEYIAP